MTAETLARWAGQAFVLGLGLGLLLLLAEGRWPQSPQRPGMGRRWLANLGALAVNLLTLRWLPQLSLLGAALLAEQNGWGLFNWVKAPAVVAVIVAWLAVDLSGYLVHRLEHRHSLLWRIHRMHHSDPDVDVTTTWRFHPFEIVLRATVHVMVAIAIGLPPIAAVGYLVLSAVTSVLSHANLRLPRTLDRAIGMVVITPTIHRTHHSLDNRDSSSNFSVCLSCWDRLFGTYRVAPHAGMENITFGVEDRSAEAGWSILKMLADPFMAEAVPALSLASRPLPPRDLSERQGRHRP